VVLTGRILERGSDQAVAGATVELGGLATRSSDANGAFLFEDVAPGRYVLRVQALGYSSIDQTVVVVRDTSLAIRLDIAPVPLDTISVAARTITIRGAVTEAETGTGLIDVDVAIPPNHQDWTDPIGRFELKRVPAGATQMLTVRGFSYLPVSLELAASKDTTLEFQLESDPVAQRMIAVQVQRLETRARPHLASVVRPITRDDLMRMINWNVLDVIKTRYPTRIDRIACILIDDVQTQRGIDELGVMLPDRFERIELLFRGAMLRLYTRDFIRRLSGGAVTLRPPLYVSNPGSPPYCR